jgi:hypothetical protein
MKPIRQTLKAWGIFYVFWSLFNITLLITYRKHPPYLNLPNEKYVYSLIISSFPFVHGNLGEA